MTNKKGVPREASAKWGFTLIEIMVVVSIVTIAFVSIIGLVQRAMVLFYNNRNVMIANNLAQEGLEMVRFVRDDNWMIPTKTSLDVNFNYFARDININHSLEEPTDPAQQKDGNTYIFSIDSRVLNDQPNTRFSINPFYYKYTTNNGTKEQTPTIIDSNIDQPVKQCADDTDNKIDIKKCLKLPEARLYRKEVSSQETINQYLNAYIVDVQSGTPIRNYVNPDGTYVYTNFNRLIITQYRDGAEPNTTTDDYLHVESWVYWQDHGKDKYFHLDTDLYDYSWRKP